jgi:hypothetical protein
MLQFAVLNRYMGLIMVWNNPFVVKPPTCP